MGQESLLFDEDVNDVNAVLSTDVSSSKSL